MSSSSGRLALRALMGAICLSSLLIFMLTVSSAAAAGINLANVGTQGGAQSNPAFLAALDASYDPADIPRGAIATLAGASGAPGPISAVVPAVGLFGVQPDVPAPASTSSSTNQTAAAQAVAATMTGISGDTCTVDVSNVYHFCDYQSTAWTALYSGQTIRYTRIIIPWDTVDTYSVTTNGCVANTTGSGSSAVFNESDGSGNADLTDLYRFVSAAVDDGMTPVIALGAGNAVGTAGGQQEPYFPNANSAHGYGSTGDFQYTCGMYGIASALKSVNYDEPFYEVYNEPDSRQYKGGTDVAPNYAANYYVDAYFGDHTFAGQTDKLIAGAFNYSSVDNSCCGYMDGYLSQLKSDVAYYSIPGPNYISGHPYNDLADWATFADFPGTTDLVSAVNQYFNGTPIWLTETGVWLNDPTPFDGSTLGAYLNNYPAGQAKAAQGFDMLSTVSGQIKGVNYYEFETYGDAVNEGSDNFDSALLGISVPEFDSEGLLLHAGGAAVPRASFCVLAYADSPSAATSDSRCDFGTYAGTNVAPTEHAEAYCSTTAGGPPAKSPAGDSCAAAGLYTVTNATSCTAGGPTISFPSVTLGNPWSNWQGVRQYAYEDCSGTWSYAGD